MNKIFITTVLIFICLASAGQQFFLRNIDEYGTHVDFNELRLFLDTTDRTDFHELRISINDSVIFKNISPLSKTRLEMETNQELLLTLETSVPVDTSWEWIDILANTYLMGSVKYELWLNTTDELPRLDTFFEISESEVQRLIGSAEYEAMFKEQ